MIMIVCLMIFVCLFLFWRFWFFFRNPTRRITENDNTILSPADGFVLYIKRVENNGSHPIMAIKGKNVIKLDEFMVAPGNELYGEAGYLVGIFMSPFDVHYNRAPIKGYIEKIAHCFPTQTLFKAGNTCMYNALSNLFFNEKPYEYDCEYLITNERASYIIKNEHVTLGVTQIADRWVKKIVTYVDKTTVSQGSVFGLIRMGSQVDIFVPEKYGFKPVIQERQHVKAGLSSLFSR